MAQDVVGEGPIRLDHPGGWMAHALEQKRDNRLVRPVSRYDGDTGRTWTPIDERNDQHLIK